MTAPYNPRCIAMGPIELVRQATPGQRTLLAAAVGWALDAFDPMLYALVLALRPAAIVQNGISSSVMGPDPAFACSGSGVR